MLKVFGNACLSRGLFWIWKWLRKLSEVVKLTFDWCNKEWVFGRSRQIGIWKDKLIDTFMKSYAYREYTQMHGITYIYIYTYIYSYTHILIYTRIFVYIHIKYTDSYIKTRTNTHRLTHTHTHTHIYIHIYIYIYIYREREREREREKERLGGCVDRLIIVDKNETEMSKRLILFQKQTKCIYEITSLIYIYIYIYIYAFEYMFLYINICREGWTEREREREREREML